ncbi:hypothetical protein EDB85DRAFT_1250858 [Lactarius pseudohatsudake]|nr:hypothetical protein EDB85DRAFT_1250858 [Lactarius pseudohatsudake]
MSPTWERIAHTGMKPKFVFALGVALVAFYFPLLGTSIYIVGSEGRKRKRREGKLLGAGGGCCPFVSTFGFFRSWLESIGTGTSSLSSSPAIFFFFCSFWNSILHVSHCDTYTLQWVGAIPPGRCVGSQALTYRIQIPPSNETSSVIYVLSLHACLYGNGQRNKNKNAHAKQALVK